uniref:Uncharacterized protein n=1 Tax=Kalanchoe fedtschenkoi TaxID=63787 RepID=A0A7N0V691_KALFE
MSGQNFIDNGEVVKSSGVRQAKRRKTETISNPDKDQIVPFKDFTTEADSKDVALNLS